jgi:hypothetical protein
MGEQKENIGPSYPSGLKQSGTNAVRIGSALPRRTDAMLAAFGTLAFLATLWLLTVVGAAVLEESGARIAAALKGTTPSTPAVAAVRVRTRTRIARPMRAAAHWRAAA